MKQRVLVFIIAVTYLFWPPALFAAEKLTIGVATNFMLPFGDLAFIFENKTSVGVDGIYMSTGSLYGQIKNGAPYDLFLAADKARPQRLVNEGLSEKAFVYARGKVVLWTAKKALCRVGTWRKALTMPEMGRVALANPETAPYGSAAVTALKGAGLWETVQGKLVFAQNVAQVFQYAHTEAVAGGFCALSSVFSEFGKRGCYFPVEKAPLIVQMACILNRTTHGHASRQFAAFLNSSEAQAVKKKYGYE
jgi:molybdate transport system substrate-binding protein